MAAQVRIASSVAARAFVPVVVATIDLDQIFGGAKPGELPLRQATRFEMVINNRTAKALGIVVPPTLIARADDVIE